MKFLTFNLKNKYNNNIGIQFLFPPSLKHYTMHNLKNIRFEKSNIKQ